MSELMQRVIEQDLGWEVTQNRIQSAGTQHGKDIQFSWRADEREYSWHIECKSHLHGSLRKEEAMPKLYDVWRSEHRIDVWCLALAHIEPGQAIDEFFAAARHMLDLSFGISVLSPAEHDLPGLFACHEDLFKRVYPSSPRINLSAETRRARIEAFGRFLLEESRKATEPRDGGWRLVTPAAPERMRVLPDDAGTAADYLRGFTRCEWDAIAHGWAVERPNAVGPMLDCVQRADPGATFGWCVGPTGEGKTTAARAAAWSLASSDPDLCVLWGEAEFDPLRLPLDWIEGLDPKIRVVLFIDGTGRLDGIGKLQKLGRHYKAEGRRVVCVLVDRGVAFARNTARRQLERNRASIRRLDLPSLGAEEISALVERLEAQGILHLSANDAKERLVAIAERELGSGQSSWLLPTLMEITDPKNRGFEEILGEFLGQLADTDRTALALMLSASLTHSARVGLPTKMAERSLGGGSGRYGEAAEILQSELLRQSRSDPEARLPNARLLTYSGLVAESVVRLAADSPALRGDMEAVCHSLVRAAGESRAGGQIPQQEFRVLDKVASFLLNDLTAFELCVLWLDDWIRLEDPPTNFVAMHRLGDCLLAWLKQALKKSQGTDRDFEEELASQARAMFIEALEVSERVLAKDVDRPPHFHRRTLGHEQRTSFTSWAVLEGVVGTSFEREQALLQSAFLSILGMGPDGPRSVGNLALNLIELKRFEMAAVVAAVEGELGGSRHIFRSLRSQLDRQEVEIPSNGLARLGGLIAELTSQVLLPGLGSEAWPYTDEARRRRLFVAVPAIRAMLPDDTTIDDLAAEWGPDPREILGKQVGL